MMGRVNLNICTKTPAKPVGNAVHIRRESQSHGMPDGAPVVLTFMPAILQLFSQITFTIKMVYHSYQHFKLYKSSTDWLSKK